MKTAKLIDTDYNPVPEEASVGFAKTADGLDIRYAQWKSRSYPVKGTVLLLHGRAEFIEKMFETVNDLRRAGFDVVTFDWRGQGGSSRMLSNPRRGYIDNFDQYVLDLETIMENVALPDCKAPYYVLAHSTGSLIALYSAPRFANRVRRMVLCAPFLGFGSVGMSQPALKIVSGTMSAIGLGEMYMGGGNKPTVASAFSRNVLTSDTRRYDLHAKLVSEHPEIALGGPTAAWVFAACRAMDQVNDPDFHSEITIPILMVCAGNDSVVNNRITEELGKRLRSGSTTYVTGAKHEILHERDVFREQLLAAFYSFVPGTELAGTL